MELKNWLLPLMLLCANITHAAPITFTIDKPSSDWTVVISGSDIFTSGKTSNIAQIHFHNTQDTFTVSSTQDSIFQKAIAGDTDVTKSKYEQANATLRQNIEQSFINVVADRNITKLTIDLSYDTEFTRPFRSLYMLVYRYCTIIGVQMKPLESTIWKWGRRFATGALYSTLLVATAYGIWKASDYLPKPATVGCAVQTGLEKTGAGLSTLETAIKGTAQSGLGAFQSWRASSTTTPPSGSNIGSDLGAATITPPAPSGLETGQ